MADQQDLPGHRRRTPEQIERRARMTAAVVEFHRAVMPVLVALDSQASCKMKFLVDGDEVTVGIKPGKSNDEAREP